MGIPADLLLEAVIYGVLLGCFYAAVSMGLSVSFGLLDVPNVAHPAIMVMGANPVRIKPWAFGIAPATAALAGAMLIIVGPVEPGMDRVYISRTFAVVVLAGLGSMTGTIAAGLVLGISESIVLMHPGLGASWAPAVLVPLLLFVFCLRPPGFFGGWNFWLPPPASFFLRPAPPLLVK